jgi:uncharacterized protein RhaS with RHS repeats
VRYYDSQIGRFWSLDPIMEGWNWYAYVGSKPTSLTDPEGTSSLGKLLKYIRCIIKCLDDYQFCVNMVAVTTCIPTAIACIISIVVTIIEPTKVTIIVAIGTCIAFLIGCLGGMELCRWKFERCREDCRRRFL